jgi:ankyrin repeat protein
MSLITKITIRIISSLIECILKQKSVLSQKYHFCIAYWNRNGCTALHYAVDGSQMKTAEFALDEGADKEAKDSEQWTPLMRGGW